MSRFLPVLAIATGSIALTCAAFSDSLPPDASYRPLPSQSFSVVRAADEAARAVVMQQQSNLLRARYDLSDRPVPNVIMSGGRKAVQAGVRVTLPQNLNWDSLSRMSPEEISERRLLPAGFMPLPHVKQATGGQVSRTTRSIPYATGKHEICVALMWTSTCPIT